MQRDIVVDTVDQDTRSRIMAKVRGKDTRPEMVVRRLVFASGYRYRLHVPNLPGKPDLVFPGRHKIIFVHGCFWHGHECPRGSRPPKANADYWRAKIERNRQRDTANVAKLEAEGWGVLVIWECQLTRVEQIVSRLCSFLD